MQTVLRRLVAVRGGMVGVLVLLRGQKRTGTASRLMKPTESQISELPSCAIDRCSVVWGIRIEDVDIIDIWTKRLCLIHAK